MPKALLMLFYCFTVNRNANICKEYTSLIPQTKKVYKTHFPICCKRGAIY